MFSIFSARVYIRAQVIAALALFALPFTSAAFAQGLVESATGNAMRPKFTARDVPSSRGRFTFPSPYNTEAVRLTEASDCNGSDCVRPVGYAYWSNINNHVGSDTMLVFLSLKGQGPTLFSYNKRSGETRNRGSIFAGDTTHGWATLSTGEGWYFSATRPNALYINEPGGSRLFRYDVINHTWETVFDFGSQMGGKYIWQVHSSNDDRVHSFAVRDKGSYAMEGCAIYREDQRKFVYFPRKGNDFDECQIDKSGKWLLIKEQLDGAAGEDNRVIDVDSNTERVLHDPDGAAGHSDLGYGYLVAEDNFNNRPGAVRVWDFNKDLRGGQPNSPVQGQGTLVYQIADWMSLAQHIAHGNSKPGLPLEQQVACASNGSGATAPRTNEIVCFKLNGSLETLVVAPTLTDVNAPGNGGMDGEAYWKFPKGNLDITGEYFIWTTNGGTNRNDAFIVKVPLDRLGASGSGAPAPDSGSTYTPPPAPDAPAPTEPAPAPAPQPAPAPTYTGGGASPVSWTEVVNASTIGNSLMKAGGCGGCPDAGAISAQSIASGDGYVEFTVPESGTLRFIGLSSNNGGTDPSEIKFALRLQNGNVEVRESGAYRTETPFSANDVMRIAYVGGTVQYSKNGNVFYTSGSGPAYPAIVDTTLFDDNATVWNVMIASGSSSGSSSGSTSGSGSEGSSSPAPVPQSAGPVGVSWTSDSNVAVNGNSLIKTGGCGGCADAGAISAQQISSGDGYVEFSGAGDGLRFIGLSSGNNGTDPSEIRFALRLQGSTAEVRESGGYRSEVSFSGGDTLRIAIVGGNVEYSKNGSVFYTSPSRASYPMLVDTSLFDGNASINNVFIAGSR
ncbi:MAG TPA: hypothetical protein VFO48_00025 [Vicinamibacterales bacterium]|nr:hypothetical protein [Vicinamibacterales bacterium]